jgi:branched-chain amino acid transport system permease protein
MEFWVAQAFNGISYASILFLLGSGLTLILGVMRIINITHGSFYLVGGYIGYFMIRLTGNFYVAIVVASMVVALMGMVIERVFLRKLTTVLPQLLVTTGIALFLQDLCLLIWGGNPLSLAIPSYLTQSIKMGKFYFPVLRLIMIGVAALLYIGLSWFQERTKAGAMLRASVDNPEVADALGINVPLVKSAVFSLGALIAGFGGVIGCGFMGVYPGLDFELLTYAFVVVIVGGMGNVTGALVGAIIVGLIDNFGKALFPELAYFTLFVPMAVVLALRPTGLFGKA